MTIRKVFKSPQELITYVNWLDIVKNSQYGWSPEDLEKLMPIFRWQEKYRNTLGERPPYTKEEDAAAKYLDSIYETRTEKWPKNDLANIPIESIYEAFYLRDIWYDLEEEPESEEPILILEKDFPYTFPVLVTGNIDSDYDRYGPVGGCSVVFTSLKEIEELKGESNALR